MQGRPLGNERNRQNKCEPEGRDKRTAPQRPFKPRKIPSAAREISTIAQRIDEFGVFENRKLLPEQNVDEETAEHPNLQDEQTQREKDQQYRRRASRNHEGYSEPK